MVLRAEKGTAHLTPGTPAWITLEKWSKVLVTQLHPTLWDSMDCSPPSSSAYRILQARVLEWVAMPSSRGSSQPRDWPWVSCITGRFFTIEPPGKPELPLHPLIYFNGWIYLLPRLPYATASDQSSYIKNSALCPVKVFLEFWLLGTGNDGSLLNS